MALSNCQWQFLKDALYPSNLSTNEIWALAGDKFGNKMILREELYLLVLEGKLDRVREGRDWVWILPNSS